jgi:hypothetical protein
MCLGKFTTWKNCFYIFNVPTPMKTERILSSINDITAAYLSTLNRIPEEKFEVTPPIGGWSYAEVYNHIFDLSLLSLEAIDQCLSPKAREVKTPFITRCILFFGSFPPAMKFKVPRQLASRVKKVDKQTAFKMIQDFEKKLHTYPDVIKKSSPLKKSGHPRLGYLNAEQWIRFIEIHLNHHLKQLKRIDKSF